MAMHKTKLKAAVREYGPLFVSSGEVDTRVKMDEDGVDPSDQEEVIEGIKEAAAGLFENFGKNATSQAQEVQDISVERNNEPLKKGHKEYDLYKVQRELAQDPKDPDKTVWTGQFIKIGTPKRTNVRIEEDRAKRLNDQSHNSGERYYPVVK